MSYLIFQNIACNKTLEDKVPSFWWARYAKFHAQENVPLNFNNLPSSTPIIMTMLSEALLISTIPSNVWMECPWYWIYIIDNKLLINFSRQITSWRRKSKNPGNLSLTIPILKTLRPNLARKYTIPFSLSLKYSKYSLWKVIWHVAPMSSIHASF